MDKKTFKNDKLSTIINIGDINNVDEKLPNVNKILVNLFKSLEGCIRINVFSSIGKTC